MNSCTGDGTGPVGIEEIDRIAEQFQALENVILLRVRQVARKSGGVAGEYRREDSTRS